jgi:hypothetical protein
MDMIVLKWDDKNKKNTPGPINISYVIFEITFHQPHDDDIDIEDTCFYFNKVFNNFKIDSSVYEFSFICYFLNPNNTKQWLIFCSCKCVSRRPLSLHKIWISEHPSKYINEYNNKQGKTIDTSYLTWKICNKVDFLKELLSAFQNQYILIEIPKPTM